MSMINLSWKESFFLIAKQTSIQFYQGEEKQSILLLLAESNFHDVNPTSDQQYPSQIVWIYHFDKKSVMIKEILPV